MLNQWHGRIVWFLLGFIMWATVLRLFDCLANLDGLSASLNGPSFWKEQQCGSQSKMRATSWHTYVCAESARAWAREVVEALGTTVLQTHSSAGWFFHLGGLSWSDYLLCWVLYFAVTVIRSDKPTKVIPPPVTCQVVGMLWLARCMCVMLTKSDKQLFHCINPHASNFSLQKTCIFVSLNRSP